MVTNWRAAREEDARSSPFHFVPSLFLSAPGRRLEMDPKRVRSTSAAGVAERKPFRRTPSLGADMAPRRSIAPSRPSPRPSKAREDKKDDLVSRSFSSFPSLHLKLHSGQWHGVNLDLKSARFTKSGKMHRKRGYGRGRWFFKKITSAAIWRAK